MNRNLIHLAVLAAIILTLGWSQTKEYAGKEQPWPCKVYTDSGLDFAAFCHAEDWLSWQDTEDCELIGHGLCIPFD